MAEVKTGWQPFTGKYTSGERLCAGRIVVAEAAYSGMVSKGDPQKYASAVLLPGLRTSKFKGADMEEVKTYAERAVKLWFDAALE